MRQQLYNGQLLSVRLSVIKSRHPIVRLSDSITLQIARYFKVLYSTLVGFEIYLSDYVSQPIKYIVLTQRILAAKGSSMVWWQWVFMCPKVNKTITNVIVCIWKNRKIAPSCGSYLTILCTIFYLQYSMPRILWLPLYA